MVFYKYISSVAVLKGNYQINKYQYQQGNTKNSAKPVQY